MATKVIETTEYTIKYNRDGQAKTVVLDNFDDVMMFSAHLNRIATPFELTRTVTVDTVEIDDGELEGIHVG